MYFTLKGSFKPYVRMTQRGKFVKPEARAYLESKEAMAYQFKLQMGAAEPFKRGEALAVSISIWRTDNLHRRDLDNEVKAILDAAQGIVYENDSWIDLINVRRFRGDFDSATVTVREIVEEAA